jgi:VWFA-related protein
MRQYLVSLAAVAASLALGLSLPQSATAQLAIGKDFGERIEVNTINVEVHVTDKSGRPVTGLQKGDFTLLEDGKPVEVVNFDAVAHAAAAPSPVSAAALASSGGDAASEREPVSWVLYVDDAFIAPGHRAHALAQLRDLLTRDLAKDDRAMVATYDRGLHIRLPFTGDHAAIARALDEIEALPADGGAVDRARRAAVQRIYEELESGGMGAGIFGKGQSEKSARHEDPEKTSSEGFNASEGQAPGCPVAIADAPRTFAAAIRHEVLDNINALTVLVNSLSGVPGRKVLLHVSDGIPVSPGEELFQVLYEMCGGGGATSGVGSSGLQPVDGRGSRTSYQGTQAMLDAQNFNTVKEWTAFAAHANAQRVTMYTLLAGGAGASGASAEMGFDERLLAIPSVASVETQNRQQTLSVMASETGGRAIFWAADLRPDLARIQADLASYYSLGFNSSHNGDGREHRLEVKVKRPGMKLLYRQSYRDKPSLERAVDRTLASLYYGYEDNPLDVGVEIGDSTVVDAKTWAVPVRLRIPLFKLGLATGADLYEGKLTVLVAIRDTAGGTSPVRLVQVPIHIPHDKAITALGQSFLYELKLNLKQGEQHLAVAVRDEATTTASFLARTVQVGGPLEAR